MPDVPALPADLYPPEQVPFSDEALDVFLCVSADAAPAVGEWTIRSDREAEWAMRMLTKYQAALDAVADEERAYLLQIRDWRDRVERRIQPHVSFFEGHLANYALAQRVLDPDRKTLDLPSGAVPTTKINARVMIEDPEELLAFCEQYLPHAIKVTKTVPLSDLKKLVDIHHYPAVWKMGLTCGCVFATDQPDFFSGAHLAKCPDCGTEGVDVAAQDLQEEERWWVTIKAESELEVPGVSVVPEYVQASVKPGPR